MASLFLYFIKAWVEQPSWPECGTDHKYLIPPRHREGGNLFEKERKKNFSGFWDRHMGEYTPATSCHTYSLLLLPYHLPACL